MEYHSTIQYLIIESSKRNAQPQLQGQLPTVIPNKTLKGFQELILSNWGGATTSCAAEHQLPCKTFSDSSCDGLSIQTPLQKINCQLEIPTDSQKEPSFQKLSKKVIQKCTLYNQKKVNLQTNFILCKEDSNLFNKQKHDL